MLVKQFIGWIAFNAFLLILILVGSGVFWLLGAGVKAMSLDDEIERWLLLTAGIAGIFSSYYTGKFLYRAASRL